MLALMALQGLEMTKYEQLRVDAMMRLGCPFCAVLGIVNTATDLHHIVEGNRRLGDWYTLSVCPGHHRGAWTPEQKQILTEEQQIGIYSGSKAFEPIYGTEREMWVKIQRRLKLPAIWVGSKILPRIVA